MIRSSERRFYQKVLDIYATSVDYTPDTELSQQFFAAVQNKMHWATHGHTAAEIIHERADAGKPFMGLLTTRPGGIVHGGDRSHFRALPKAIKIGNGLSHGLAFDINIAINEIMFPISEVVALRVPPPSDHASSINVKAFVVHSMKQ